MRPKIYLQIQHYQRHTMVNNIINEFKYLLLLNNIFWVRFLCLIFGWVLGDALFVAVGGVLNACGAS